MKFPTSSSYCSRRWCVSATDSAHAGDIYVVTRADVKLTAGDIREIYLGDKEFDGTVRIVPIDNQAAQADFAAKVLAMSVDRYNTLWIKKAFRDALNPPAVKATDSEVLEFVKRTHGAVGYLSSRAARQERSHRGQVLACRSTSNPARYT